MDSLLSNYDEKANFWKLYPTFKVPSVFKDLYNSDKSKNKKFSSDLMWALCFLFDKTAANPYKTLQKQDKIEVVNEDILNNPGFDWEMYADLYKEGERIFFTEIERTYYSYVEKMEQRRKLIEDSEYTLETASTLDKIIKDTESVRKEMDNLKRLVDQQEIEGTTKGNIILSATEKKEI